MKFKSTIRAMGLCALAACSDVASSPATAPLRAPLSGPALDLQAAPIPNTYIVRFHDNEPSPLGHAQAIERVHGATMHHLYVSAIKGASFTMTDAAAELLRADASIYSVEQDQTVHISTTELNPTWGIDRIDQRNRPLSNSYSYGTSGSGVTIYIIDTGINFTHSEYSGRAFPGTDIITPGGTAADCNGHGSHVSGTAGGTVYGVAKAVRLVSVRVLDCSGSGSISGVIAGVDWVTRNARRPAAANMSLGGGFSSTMNQAVENSIAAGVVYTIAAGNSAANACNTSPASAPSAITVGATDINDAFASFSNFGSCVRINAPGVNIKSAWIGSNTATNTISGTSMAAPHTAGAAALYLEAFPSASPSQVRTALTGNATASVLSGVPAGTPNVLLFTSFLSQSPVASFTSSCAALACSFDGSGTTALASATYNWTFGDGTTGSGKTVSHAFAVAGSYSVSLTVTDANGANTKTTTVAVSGPSNQPPVARFTISCVSLTCSADASTSSDDVKVVSYTWNWGNGSPQETHGVPTRSKTYSSAGTYSVTLTVTDGGGLTNSTTRQVTVTGGGGNQPPVARFTIRCSALTCSADGSASTDDVKIVSYTWSWGDGTQESHGVPTRTKTYRAPGTYTVTLTVADAGGLTNSTSQQVTTMNQPPVARFTISCPTLACTADASASTDDVKVVTYTWSWGDGSAPATHGVARGGITYTTPGVYTVTLTATDGGGLTGTISKRVTVPFSTTQ